VEFLPLPFQQFLEGNDLLEPVDGTSAFYARQAGAQLSHRLVDAPPECRRPSPTSSASLAISTVALMRSCSAGVRPVAGSVVTSPTLKIPNCTSSYRTTQS
jgi:hypothetical protein